MRLKEIKQLVSNWHTFEVLQVFQVYRHLCKIIKNLELIVYKLYFVIGQCKIGSAYKEELT